jgi:hypothetical protein
MALTMTPSTKKLITLALAAEFGPIVRHSLRDPARRARYFADCPPEQINLIFWHCDQIAPAGRRAFETLTQGLSIDGPALRLCERKLTEAVRVIDGDGIDLLQILSFIWAALLDIEHYMHQRKRPPSDREATAIRDVIEAVTGFITAWDPNISEDDTHAQALEDYEKWMSA